MIGIYCRTSKDTNDGASIEQQKKFGIEFCTLNSFEYQVYEDEGRSGFKLSDDDDDPFKNRPSFNKLISDIKKGLIDKVWVYEHSRISRNLQNSTLIFTLFDKYKVRVFEKNNELNLKDNTSQFLRHILDAASQYERNMIVERTTRGLYNAIDNGKRAHCKFYGYRRIGKNENGNLIWEPVSSEIEKLKYAYRRFLEGATVRQITFEIIDVDSLDKHDRKNISTKWARFLRHFEYTGNSLNVEGLKILHKYDNFDIDSVRILNDEKYYVKSQAYSEELISIEDWIKVVERLHTNRKSKHDLKNKLKKACRDLATGLIKCSECGFRYYAYLQRYVYKEQTRYYNYYKHHTFYNSKYCVQSPKTIIVDKIDEIFKLFYFFFYIVFDNTKELIKESQQKNKIKQKELTDKIGAYEKEISRIDRQIEKFNTVLDTTSNTNDIKVLAHRITENEEKKSEIESKNLTLKSDLENIKIKFENEKIIIAYYDVKERVLKWFNDMGIEQQRNELIKIIKECLIFGHYILIDTGEIIFLFDTEREYTFDQSMLVNLNKDEVYKKNFVDISKDNKNEVETLEGKRIANFILDDDRQRELASVYLSIILNVKYDISKHNNLILFMDLKGLLQFGEQIDYYANTPTKTKSIKTNKKK
jgi:DNA invertase Pin-like site-specific DNA recombinase